MLYKIYSFKIYNNYIYLFIWWNPISSIELDRLGDNLNFHGIMKIKKILFRFIFFNYNIIE
jgi:hypothetical protein